jgi:hypothetical protein
MRSQFILSRVNLEIERLPHAAVTAAPGDLMAGIWDSELKPRQSFWEVAGRLDRRVTTICIKMEETSYTQRTLLEELKTRTPRH